MRTLCTRCDYELNLTVDHDVKRMAALVQSAHQATLKIFATRHKDMTLAGEFELAVNEALQNAFRHGKGDVTLCIGYAEDIDTICAAITDKGAGTQKSIITDTEIMPPLQAAHGRGFPIMNICANVMCVKRPGSFTVYLTKGLNNAVSSNASSCDGVHGISAGV